MKATTMTLTMLLVIGSVVFSGAQAQSNNNTASISSTGAITSQNPTSWITAVTLQSSGGGGVGAAYEVTFRGAAPSASSCTATSANSGLTSMVTALTGMPNQLLVSFQQSGSGGGLATPVTSAFTLTCESSS
jgi:hypothetical protein